MAPTTKLLLLLAVVAAQHYGTTAPNERPSSEELREQKGPELGVGYFTALVKTAIWSWTLIEGSLLFALSDHCPPSLSRPILQLLIRVPTSPSSSFLSSLTTLTPAFLTGTLLSISGSLLRAYCFHTLGRFFTFELSIRNGHALVTRGPYGVVRHPSYTAGVGLAMGLGLCVMERTGWVVACSGIVPAREGGGVSGVAVGVVMRAGVWVVELGVLGGVIKGRMDGEDAMLEKNFGDEWRAWARRVPYRLVPGVY